MYHGWNICRSSSKEANRRSTKAHTDPSIYSALHHDTRTTGPSTKENITKKHETHNKKQQANMKAVETEMFETSSSLSSMPFRLALATGGCPSPALAIQQMPKQASSPTSPTQVVSGNPAPTTKIYYCTSYYWPIPSCTHPHLLSSSTSLPRHHSEPAVQVNSSSSPCPWCAAYADAGRHLELLV